MAVLRTQNTKAAAAPAKGGATASGGGAAWPDQLELQRLRAQLQQTQQQQHEQSLELERLRGENSFLQSLGLGALAAAAPQAASAKDLDVDVIKAMLRRENELRLCDETQAAFRQQRDSPEGWLGVVEGLQRRVAAEFGLTEAVGLDAMRCAESLLPGDEEVIEISLYRKFNRCKDGALAVGMSAPDAALYDLAGEPVALTTLMARDERPLCVFAGSYTWPPFRALLGSINELVGAWSGKVRFAMVYIAEAHAVDEWPVALLDKDFEQHKSLEDRLQAAREFKADHEIAAPLATEIYADTIGNDFNESYSSWPFRFWVIEQGAVGFKAMPQHSTYDLQTLEDWLQARFA